MTKHFSCCQSMQYALAAPEIPIDFGEKFRETQIRVLDGGSSGMTLNYCPWCGAKLPSSLRDRWYDIVTDEMGLEPDSQEIPAEFMTGDWWLSRQL